MILTYKNDNNCLFKVLNKKILQNEAKYGLDRKAAKIFALSSNNLDKYEYLTGEDLGLTPNAIEQARFEYSPLGKSFNKGLSGDDQKEEFFKRLKNIEDKNEEQLKLLKLFKANKISVDQGSEFYKKAFEDFLKINNIEMYSTYNEGKSVVAERFIRTLKNKILKHMTAISRNIYFDVLDDIVDKYNNTVHRTIKMKPTKITNDYYAEYNEHPSNKRNPKFKVGDNVIISKYKNIKDILQIGHKKFLLLIKLIIQFLAHMLLVIWMVKKLLEVFAKKNCKRLIKKNFEHKKDLKEKVINYMSNGKDMIIHLIVGLIKKISYKNESILS